MLTSTIAKTAVVVLLTLTAGVWHPGGGDFKCFEDFRAITDTASPQHELQQEAWTDQHGLRRVGGFYCVALGSAYGTEIGARYIITLSTGAEFLVILADQKADRDTIKDHTRDRTGAILEFIVDTQIIPTEVRHAGDISRIPGFEGQVETIRRIKK